MACRGRMRDVSGVGRLYPFTWTGISCSQLLQYRQRCEELETSLHETEVQYAEQLRSSEEEHTRDLEAALARLEDEQSK